MFQYLMLYYVNVQKSRSLLLNQRSNGAILYYHMVVSTIAYNVVKTFKLHGVALKR